MRTIETTVYKFDELTNTAKEKARYWYRSSDSNDWEHVYSDADECAAILGIDIDRRSYRTMGGGTGSEPTIYFSGFSSQGDGACFVGHYTYKKGAAKSIRSHAPQDAELHRIADTLQKIQSRHFYKLSASMAHRGHYWHSGCMSVDVSHLEDTYRDIGDAEEDIRQLMRDFADWIYKQLEREHDYRNSDEVIDEDIRANEYEFTEDGERA